MKRIKLFEEFNESVTKLITIEEFIGDGVESDPRRGKTMAQVIQKYFKLPLDKILTFEYDTNDPMIISYMDSLYDRFNPDEMVVWEVPESLTDIRNRQLTPITARRGELLKVTAHKWLTTYSDLPYKLLTLDCTRTDGEDEYGFMILSQEGLIALSIAGIIPWASWASPEIIHKYRGRALGKKYGL